ncbi:MAG: CD225/dispanin family protein [Panacibacter sp.]
MDQNYQQNPSLQQPPLTPPKNWLVESILVTILCCLPFGIAGIVFASQVNTKYAAGDYNGALQASKDAGKWTKIGFFVGIGVIILYIIWIFFVVGVAAFSSRYNF